jgi:hypothetical protein
VTDLGRSTEHTRSGRSLSRAKGKFERRRHSLGTLAGRYAPLMRPMTSRLLLGSAGTVTA